METEDVSNVQFGELFGGGVVSARNQVTHFREAARHIQDRIESV